MDVRRTSELEDASVETDLSDERKGKILKEKKSLSNQWTVSGITYVICVLRGQERAVCPTPGQPNTSKNEVEKNA